jgi:hypothetical protein
LAVGTFNYYIKISYTLSHRKAAAVIYRHYHREQAATAITFRYKGEGIPPSTHAYVWTLSTVHLILNLSNRWR